MDRRDFLKVTALAGAGMTLLDTSAVLAHHGWAWATDENFEITGTITAVKLGNPHGELTLDAKGANQGEKWTIEIGQPWRNERAGLTKALLKTGTEVTILGKRAKDPKLKVAKAERVTIAGKNYDLYPERLGS
jgi:hypothetical protein